MIPLLVTVCALSTTVWMLSWISWWLAMFWIMWVVTGVTWFCMNLGNKTSPDKWYDRVLLAPVLPLAWMFGQIDSRCALTIRE